MSATTKTTYEFHKNYIYIVILLFSIFVFAKPVYANIQDDYIISIEDGYLGVVCEKDSSLKIIIESDLEEGTISFQEPEVGKLSGGGLNHKTRIKKDVFFTYTPPSELGYEYTNQLVEDGDYSYYPLTLTFFHEVKNQAPIVFTKTIKLYKKPVVLVTGLKENNDNLSKLEKELKSKKYYTYLYQDSYLNGYGSILNLHEKIDSIISSYQSKNILINTLDIVSHGAGCLLSKEYSSYSDSKASKVIMLSPFLKGISYPGYDFYKSILSYGYRKKLEQFYTFDSEYIHELNQSKLNENVEYATISSNDYFDTDGLVPSVVQSYSGIHHSDMANLVASNAFSQIGSSITSDPLVFAQIEAWLTAPIPKKPNKNVSLQCARIMGSVTQNDIFLDTKEQRYILSNQIISTKTNSKLQIAVSINNVVIGYIDLHPNTEIIYDAVNDNQLQITLIKGKARFRNISLNEFSYKVIVNSKDIRYLLGKSDFVIENTSLQKVAVLKDYAKVVLANSIYNYDSHTIYENKIRLLSKETEIYETTIHQKWWLDEFYSKPSKLVQFENTFLDTLVLSLTQIPLKYLNLNNIYINIAISIIAILLFLSIITGIYKLINSNFEIVWNSSNSKPSLKKITIQKKLSSIPLKEIYSKLRSKLANLASFIKKLEIATSLNKVFSKSFKGLLKAFNYFKISVKKIKEKIVNILFKKSKSQ